MLQTAIEVEPAGVGRSGACGDGAGGPAAAVPLVIVSSTMTAAFLVMGFTGGARGIDVDDRLPQVLDPLDQPGAHRRACPRSVMFYGRTAPT